MAQTFYYIEDAASGGATVTLIDGGTLTSWLIFRSAHDYNEIRLPWTVAFGTSTEASGHYMDGATGSRLVIKGVVDNAQGADGADWIAGNEVGNVLMGDALDTGTGGNDSLFGAEGNDTIFGGAGKDSISGGGDNDQLFGNDGADTITGDGGADVVEGGAGADSLSGGATVGDTVSYAASAAGVVIRLTHGATTTGTGGDAAGDRINGFLNATGSAHADTITDTNASTIAFGYNANRFDSGGGHDRLGMGGGNDTAIGGAGNDTISGGLGRDIQTGGTGADRFVFTKLADSTVLISGRDTISDFSHAQHDRIDLSAIDANGTGAGNGTFRYLGTAPFSGARGELRLLDYGPGWRVIGDVNGDRVADFAIDCAGATLPKLLPGDFIL